MRYEYLVKAKVLERTCVCVCKERERERDKLRYNT